jgi:pyruvate formate lyase activating enzyme
MAESGQSGLVFNIAHFSVHDGPGIRTTVFLKGCPLHCWWCHNPESQSSRPEVIYFRERCRHCGECIDDCPNRALTMEGGEVRTDEGLCRRCGSCADTCLADARELAGLWMTVDDVLANVERDRMFYEESGGGVTLSGGEPLQQPEFTEALLRACKLRGIHTAVDTCGFATAASLQRIAPHVDLFLFDLKVIDPIRHREVTGASNDVILNNLEWLAKSTSEVVIRVPVIPGFTDDEANLCAICDVARSSAIRRIDLLPYHRIAMDKYQRLKIDYRLATLAPPTADRMNSIAGYIAGHGIDVRIGG